VSRKRRRKYTEPPQEAPTVTLIRASHAVFGVQDVPDNDYYRENGWSPVDESTPTDTDKAADEAAQQALSAGLFDPSEHTVDEVLDYLDEATPDERDRVLAAEEAGQARKTLLNP
jgi:hypothetical protein